MFFHKFNLYRKNKFLEIAKENKYKRISKQYQFNIINNDMIF